MPDTVIRPATIGILHPGEMGCAVGGALRSAGSQVLWASAGRSPATRARAADAGLEDVVELAALPGRCDMIISICPPHAALSMATAVAGLNFTGIYLDANAVSPETSRHISKFMQLAGAEYVDGAIVGTPPAKPGMTHLYLSGSAAGLAAEKFNDTLFGVTIVPGDIGAASAVKMAYAAWSKGTKALLLAIVDLAESEGVIEPLLQEWSRSHPGLVQQVAAARRSASLKGWRWVAEMEEIEATFLKNGLPGGFAGAAAEVYRIKSALPIADLMA